MFYALFDLEHDLRHGLRSWATRWGTTGVFVGARVLHLGTSECSPRSVPALPSASGTGSASLRSARLLLYEHLLVRPADLRRLDAAFFTVNGVISFVFFAFVAAGQRL